MATILDDVVQWLNFTPEGKMTKKTAVMGLAGIACVAIVWQFLTVIVLATQCISALFCIAWLCKYSGALKDNPVPLLMCNLVLDVGCALSAAILNIIPEALGNLRAQDEGQLYFGLALLILSFLL